MQATGAAEALDKPSTSHKYSQWALPFKSTYSWKLHKQIVIDRGGGVRFDSQSKQLYMDSHGFTFQVVMLEQTFKRRVRLPLRPISDKSAWK